MDGILGNLVVKISSDLTNLNAGLKNAEKNIRDTSGKLDAYAKKIGTGMTLVGAAITGAFALMVKATVDYNDAIYETSVRTGVAVETLSKLRYVADQTESSFEAVAMGMKFLNRNIYEATSGNLQMNHAFQALGITLRDKVTGQVIKAEEAFFQIADRFKNIEDGAAKTALAMQIFGRGGESLIPVLNLGSDGIQRLSREADRLGLVLTTKNAKAIDEFSDSMKSLKSSFGGLWLEISTSVIPTLEKFIKITTEAVVKVRQWSQEHPELSKGLANASLAAGVLLTVLGGMVLVLAKIISSLQLLNIIFPGLIALLSRFGIIGATALASFGFARFMSEITGLDRVTSGPNGWLTRMYGWALKNEEKLQSILRIMQAIFTLGISELIRKNQVPATQPAAAPVELGKIEVKKTSADLTGTIDQLAIHEQKQREINDAYINGRITTREYYDELSALQQDGITDRENEAASIGNFMQTIQSMHKTMTQTMFDFMNMAVTNFSSGLTNAITGIIMGTKKASEAFKEFGLSMVEAIVQFVVQWGVQALIAMVAGKLLTRATVAMAEQIAAAWAPAAYAASVATMGGAVAIGTGALAGGMGATMALFKGVKGLQIASPTGGGGGWAKGGSFGVDRPTMLLVGEEGPEHVRITPEGQSGGTPININFYDTKVANDIDIKAMGEQLGYEIETRLRYARGA